MATVILQMRSAFIEENPPCLLTTTFSFRCHVW